MKAMHKSNNSNNNNNGNDYDGVKVVLRVKYHLLQLLEDMMRFSPGQENH